MWEKIRVIFTIPELRMKIFFTLALLAVFRIGSHIPLPVFDQTQLQKSAGAGGIMDYVSAFSGANIEPGHDLRPGHHALYLGLDHLPAPGQRLSAAGKAAKRRRDGPQENQRIHPLRHRVSLPGPKLGLHQRTCRRGGSNIDYHFLNNPGVRDSGLQFSWQLICVLTATAGTIFLMWLGEQIDEYGIGNGISLLIMGGILARLPNAVRKLLDQVMGGGGLEIGSGHGKIGVEMLVILILLFVGVILGVVLISQAQRRITTQSAKHVRGRKVWGGGKQYLPLRINQAGVMPIIFASSLLLFPWYFFHWLASKSNSVILFEIENQFHRGDSFIYNLLYVALIYFFCYFWTAISFNPKDMADNLKNYGTFIPGYRPGRRTADYLEKVMVRITYVGAGFLSVVAIIPTIITSSMPNIDYTIAAFYGGTSLLIAVSVAFDLVQKIDSHLVMRNYKGLLE